MTHPSLYRVTIDAPAGRRTLRAGLTAEAANRLRELIRGDIRFLVADPKVEEEGEGP